MIATSAATSTYPYGFQRVSTRNAPSRRFIAGSEDLSGFRGTSTAGRRQFSRKQKNGVPREAPPVGAFVARMAGWCRPRRRVIGNKYLAWIGA